MTSQFPPVIRVQIRDAIVQALLGNTIAGQNVTSARDWPTATADIATGYIIVPPGKEHKERLSRGQPLYTTTATIDVLARVARGGPETALQYIEFLAQQIANTVICYRPIYDLVQYAPNVDIDVGLVSEGDLAGLAQCAVSFSFEYPEKFQPGPGVPLQSIQNSTEGSFGSFAVDYSEP
jgi:hypothetical protein